MTRRFGVKKKKQLKMEVNGRIMIVGLLVILLFVSLSDQATPTWVNMPPPNNIGIAENTAVGTALPYTPMATDADGDAIAYDETTGNTYFVIASTSGVISVSAALDFETIPTTHTLTITATANGETITANYFIDVVDVNEDPAFALASYTLSAAEGQAYGTLIGSPGFAISDVDSGDSYTCTMTCPTPGKFRMDKSPPCSVRFSSVYSLDAGDTTPVQCTVKATDSGGLTATTTLTFSITDANNYTPRFDKASYYFYQDYYAGAGTTLAAAGTITATDSDAGTNGALQFSIDEATLPYPQDYYSIDATTGVLTTTRAMDGNCNCPNTPLDFTVTVTDGGGLTHTVPITVVVGPTTSSSSSANGEWQYGFFDDPDNIWWFIICLVVALTVLVAGAIILYRYCCNYRRYAERRDYHRHRRDYDEQDDYDDRPEHDDYYRPHKPRHSLT